MCLHTTTMEVYTESPLVTTTLVLLRRLRVTVLQSAIKVHSLTTYSDESFAFSDTGDFCIKAYNPAAKQFSVIVGNEKGTRDGSKAQFSQPTGICCDYETLFAIDTATATLRMTSSVTSLVDYLEHLHIFGETFGLHTRKSTWPQ